MIIKNGNVLVGREFVPTDLEFDRVITALGPDRQGGEVLDAADGYVLPGLIDIHTHGAVGHDFSTADREGLQAMADYYADHGVTSVLPTTLTLPEQQLTRAARTIREFTYRGGAKWAGIHLEGPFFSREKCGGQPPEHLHRPDAAMFHRINRAAGGRVRLVDVACEEEGGMDFIREVSRTCAVSLGHTAADYDTAMAAYAAGATHATHLFNCMPPLHHRQPGVVGAAMDSGAWAELICDGLHVHPALIRATFALFGERTVLISDSLTCAGLPDGDYNDAGGHPIQVRDGLARLAGTDTIAGSSISLLEGLRRVVASGIPLAQAAYAATTAPALAVGLENVGALEPGRAADIIVLSRDLELRAVFMDGRRR